MKKSTMGALLLIFLGAMAVGAYKFLMPLLFERERVNTSDASQPMGTLHIAGDNYLGYWFITSPDMRKSCAREGLEIEFTDDGGAYAQRLQKFSDRDYDAIVLPVNSYLSHGATHDYPGVIVAAICESRGADGIVAFEDRMPTGKINDLNDASLKFVYTSESPSSFLLDLTMADFDLNQLKTRDDWRQEVGGSREVLKALEKGDGDVFVLWEPDLSRALKQPGIRYVWGSDRFSGYIVDVFVFHRDVVKRKPEQVTLFLKHYFRTLRLYGNNRDQLLREMSRSADLKREQVTQITEKIEWYDLYENAATQFGIPTRPGEIANDGMISTIIANTDVLLRMGHFPSDPLKGNPYVITQSSFLEQILQQESAAPMGTQGSSSPEFESLNDEAWDKLREVGVFRVEPITFQSWNNLLTSDGKAVVDRIAQLLKHNYPSYRIVVRGHTAPGGDEQENLKLSLSRAQTVMQYLKAVHNLNPARMHAKGVGSTIPPARKPGESERAYRYRQARVEFIAVEGNTL